MVQIKTGAGHIEDSRSNFWSYYVQVPGTFHVAGDENFVYEYFGQDNSNVFFHEQPDEY